MPTDNTPQCVKEVLDKPGIYEFSEDAFYWFFEVADGEVYQLQPDTMARDRVLSPGGWHDCDKICTVKKVEL